MSRVFRTFDRAERLPVLERGESSHGALLEHRAAEGPADERCHHRLSQRRAPLSPYQMCEKLWTLPCTLGCEGGHLHVAYSETPRDQCVLFPGLVSGVLGETGVSLD
jgi:hypothetical protein